MLNMSGRFHSGKSVLDMITTPPGRKMPKKTVKKTPPNPPSSRPSSSSCPPLPPAAARLGNAEFFKENTFEGILRSLESKIDKISKSQESNSSQIQMLSEKLTSIENVMDDIHHDSTSASSGAEKVTKKIPKDILVSWVVNQD